MSKKKTVGSPLIYTKIMAPLALNIIKNNFLALSNSSLHCSSNENTCQQTRGKQGEKKWKKMAQMKIRIISNKWYN